MTLAVILLTIVNLVFGIALLVIWKKMNRPAKDDPRLSRGLQLLQSKISVLEDLSDRTDRQVKQLVTLLEQKTRQIQNKIIESEKQIQRIDQSMHKSLEVANIFQDKIPHEEIIQRQTSVKYIQAARMAHQGKSVDEIVESIGLPRGEVEFIAKVNKDQLMFDENNLPEWARTNDSGGEAANNYLDQYGIDNVDLSPRDTKNISTVFEIPKVDFQHLDQMGMDFKQACDDVEERERRHEESQFHLTETKVYQKAKSVTQKIVDQASGLINEVGHSATQAFHDVETAISREREASIDFDSEPEGKQKMPPEALMSPEDPEQMSLSRKLDQLTPKKMNFKSPQFGFRKSAIVNLNDETKVIKKVIFPSIDRRDLNKR